MRDKLRAFVTLPLGVPLLTLGIILIQFQRANAQIYNPRDMQPEQTPIQSVYLEVGGNAILYSLNYDIVLDNFGFRLGIMPYGYGSVYDRPSRIDPDGNFLTFDAFLGVFMANYLTGSGPHKLELGGGILFGDIQDNVDWDYPRPPGLTFTVGYRYLSPKNGFTFRAGFTPVLTSHDLRPGFGISFGWLITEPENN